MATLFDVLRTARAALADVNGLTVCVEHASHLDAPNEAKSRMYELVERVKPLAGRWNRGELLDALIDPERGQLDSLSTELARERARLAMEYPTITGYVVTAEFSGATFPDNLPFAEAFYRSLDTVCAELARRGVDASADYWRPDPDADENE